MCRAQILCKWIFGTMIYSGILREEQCKKLSNEYQIDNLIISDLAKATDDKSELITDNKNIEKRRLTLRRSSARHVITNNDLEDIQDRGIENNNSSSTSRGESV